MCVFIKNSKGMMRRQILCDVSDIGVVTSLKTLLKLLKDNKRMLFVVCKHLVLSKLIEWVILWKYMKTVPDITMGVCKH